MKKNAGDRPSLTHLIAQYAALLFYSTFLSMPHFPFFAIYIITWFLYLTGDRILGGSNARWLLEGPARGIWVSDLGVATSARVERDRSRRILRARLLIGAIARPLQYDGHRFDDERARRGARYVAPRLRLDPGALS